MKRWPPQTKRQHLQQLVAEKQAGSEPLPKEEQDKGFRGWHERGYLPHCDRPGLIQFVTFRLWDSLPASRRAEWEPLLYAGTRNKAPRLELNERENQRQLEAYLDSGWGECFLREGRLAGLVEKAMLHHHGQRFRMLAWVVMPNHVHALMETGQTPLAKTLQNWKSIVAVGANKMLGRAGRFWQAEYWDRFMRDEVQTQKAVRYIENNPVKAKLCRAPEEWLFSSARFRNPETRGLEIPR